MTQASDDSATSGSPADSASKIAYQGEPGSNSDAAREIHIGIALIRHYCRSGDHSLVQRDRRDVLQGDRINCDDGGDRLRAELRDAH